MHFNINFYFINYSYNIEKSAIIAIGVTTDCTYFSGHEFYNKHQWLNKPLSPSTKHLLTFVSELEVKLICHDVVRQEM